VSDGWGVSGRKLEEEMVTVLEEAALDLAKLSTSEITCINLLSRSPAKGVTAGASLDKEEKYLSQ
jgi:hypothetical protein